MPEILTLTLNPAVDLSTATDALAPSHKLRCDAARVDPGGGGVNVARVLHRLGATVRAIATVGGPSGHRLADLLAREGVPLEPVPIAQDTRESFTVLERRSGNEYRFVLPGPTLAPDEWREALARLLNLVRHDTWVVASGSAPPGVPDEFHAQLAHEVAKRGGRLALDASGASLARGLDANVFLVKPSLRELEGLLNVELRTQAEQLRAARSLVAQGKTSWVALSLGPDGALLVGHDGAWRAAPLDVPVMGTVGAGDSFMAGLVWSMARGDAPETALATASAAGAAAVMHAGTALCGPADVQRLLADVRIARVG